MPGKSLQPGGHFLGADVVETHPVDQGLMLGDSKQPGLGIARLCAWRDGSYFDGAKAQSEETWHRFGVLVQPCGQAERVREVKAASPDGKVDRASRCPGPVPTAQPRCGPEESEYPHPQPMGGFRRNSKKQRSQPAVHQLPGPYQAHKLRYWLWRTLRAKWHNSSMGKRSLRRSEPSSRRRWRVFARRRG